MMPPDFSTTSSAPLAKKENVRPRASSARFVRFFANSWLASGNTDRDVFFPRIPFPQTRFEHLDARHFVAEALGFRGAPQAQIDVPSVHLVSCIGHHVNTVVRTDPGHPDA